MISAYCSRKGTQSVNKKVGATCRIDSRYRDNDIKIRISRLSRSTHTNMNKSDDEFFSISLILGVSHSEANDEAKR